MSQFLQEIAEKLNKQHDEAVKAELERTQESKRQERMQSYYTQFGEAWFKQLSSEIDQLIDEFNLVTGDHSKLSRVESDWAASNTITVVFIRNRKQTEQPPTCIITRETAERKGSIEIRHSKHPTKDLFEIGVKEFASFQIRVFAKKTETKFGEGVEWKDRNTGEMNYEPTFYEKKGTQQFVLNSPTEFASYILTFFTRHILEHGV